MGLAVKLTGDTDFTPRTRVQAMQQAQADKLDHWAFYQARNLREEVAKHAAYRYAA